MKPDVFVIVGSPFVRFFEYSVDLLTLIYLSVRSVFHQPHGVKRNFVSVVSAQIYFTGVQALPLVGVLALGTGLIVVMQAAMSLTKLGGLNFLGQILVSSVIRELGPLLTSVVVIARSGTAVASDIGGMRVNKEIDALETMGIDPFYYVVLPRLLGGIISTIGLAIIFVFVTLMSGFIIAHVASDLSFQIYLSTIASAVTTKDIFVFATKSSLGGLIVFSVACYQGLSVANNPTEIPRRTTTTVVHSMASIMFFNAAITFFLFFDALRVIGIYETH